MLLRFIMIFAIIGFLAGAAFLSGYVSGQNNLVARAHTFLTTWHLEADYQKEELLAIGVNPDTGFHEFTDALRDFIYRNSEHHSTAKFGPYGTWENVRSLAIRRLLDSQINGDPKPGLMCSSRAGAMQQLLSDFGYQSRMVHIFSQGPGNHTFLEVLNPTTNEWEIQDPEYNITYIHQDTGKRPGVNDLILQPLADILPCRGKNDCTWDHVEILYPEKYYGAAMMLDWDEKPPVLLINRNRFDLDGPLRWDNEKRPIRRYVQDMWGKDFGGIVDIIVDGAP